jgi:outer membrane murein-binding lipoprotein Lpp
MNNRIYYILAAALFTLGLLSGCKTLTPLEATKSTVDEVRTLISEHVADEARAKQMIALVDQLENDLMAYVEIRTAHNEALRKKNADYDASREDMQNLYGAYNRDTRAIGMKIAQTHLDMKKLATPEEWAVISKPKHRIGGF